jgi:hypothetical protein
MLNDPAQAACAVHDHHMISLSAIRLSQHYFSEDHPKKVISDTTDKMSNCIYNIHRQVQVRAIT